MTTCYWVWAAGADGEVSVFGVWYGKVRENESIKHAAHAPLPLWRDEIFNSCSYFQFFLPARKRSNRARQKGCAAGTSEPRNHNKTHRQTQYFIRKSNKTEPRRLRRQRVLYIVLRRFGRKAARSCRSCVICSLPKKCEGPCEGLSLPSRDTDPRYWFQSMKVTARLGKGAIVCVKKNISPFLICLFWCYQFDGLSKRKWNRFLYQSFYFYKCSHGWVLTAWCTNYVR